MSTQPGREIVPAYPYDLGEVMAGSFRAIRRRPGLFFGLTLVGLATAAVVLLVLGLGFLGTLRDSLEGSSVEDQTGTLVAIALLFGAGMIVAGLVQLKANGMLSLATKELADGREPTLGGLWSGTRGFVPKVVLLAIVFYLALIVVVGLLVVVVAAAAASGSDGAGVVTGLLVIVGFLVFIPVAIFLWVRLLYVLPVLAIERTPAFAALGRSWRLTAGRFWRTLGYILVATLVVIIVQAVISLPFQVSGATTQPRGDLTVAQLNDLLLEGALSIGAGLLSSFVTAPFMAAYQALMYVDAQRRTDQPPGYGYGYGPGYGPGTSGPGYGPGSGTPPPPPQYPYGQQPPPGQNPYG
jgi:hypothetical protein